MTNITLTWILSNRGQLFLFRIIFIWSWNQFKSISLKLIFYDSIIWSLWSTSNLTLFFRILVNRIMRRNRTIFIHSTIHKFLWVLEIIRTDKHWLFNKSTLTLIVFVMFSKFIKINLPTSNLIFSISFLSQFFNQLTFIFLQKVYKLLTFLMLFMFFNRRSLFFYFSFEILCRFVTVCFKKYFFALTSLIPLIYRWKLFLKVKCQLVSNTSTVILKSMLFLIIGVDRHTNYLWAQFKPGFFF